MAKVDLSELAVIDIMLGWPETVRVFIDWQMKCVGCPIAAFHTLADAAAEHGYVLADVETAMQEAIARDEAHRRE